MLVPKSVLSLYTRLSPGRRGEGGWGEASLLRVLRPSWPVEGVLPGCSWQHGQEEGTAGAWEAESGPAISTSSFFLLIVPHPVSHCRLPELLGLSLASRPLLIPFPLPRALFILVILTNFSGFFTDVASPRKPSDLPTLGLVPCLAPISS